MATKKASTKPKAASKTSTASSSKDKETVVSKAQTFLALILVITVINSLLLLGLIFAGGSSSGSSAKIDDISVKMDAIDEFYTQYVDGYVSPTGDSGNQAPPAGQPSGNQQAPQNPTGLQVNVEGEPFLGDANAEVVIAEFSDYECPFCKRFFDNTYPQLKEEYIDTGKVKFVFKDFPLGFHPEAKPAAIAANCVYTQLGNEAYFEFHDLLFNNQQQLSSDNYRTWAEQVGADLSAYDTCIEDPSVAEEIDGDLAEGQELGVSGTPSFIIGDELVVGAQPYSVIREVIESKLN